jgi:hypothetical protein
MTVDYLPPRRSLPADRLEAMRADIEQFVASHPVPRKRRWRRRNFLAGMGAIVIVLGGGGTAAAWAYLHPRAVTDQTQARCYSDDLYVRGATFHGTTVATPDSATVIGRVQDALDTCASLWQVGAIQSGAPVAITNRNARTYPVPALVGCTLPDGAAAVFPGTADTCDRVGLAPQLPPATRVPQPVDTSEAPPGSAPPS